VRDEGLSTFDVGHVNNRNSALGWQGSRKLFIIRFLCHIERFCVVVVVACGGWIVLSAAAPLLTVGVGRLSLFWLHVGGRQGGSSVVGFFLLRVASILLLHHHLLLVLLVG
jgi:hypothetical protein